MKYKELRVRISDKIMERYVAICDKHNLSMPKQTSAMIKQFVEIQEDNDKKIDQVNGVKI